MYKFLQRILKSVQQALEENDIPYKRWTLSDQTFEKLGELMSQNGNKALGLYDELTNFLSQVNLYSGNKGLLDTHEFTKVLELFMASDWSRQTGKHYSCQFNISTQYTQYLSFSYRKYSLLHIIYLLY